MMLSSVDLPMPDSPTMAAYSPAPSSRQMPWSRMRAPKRLVTFFRLSRRLSRGIFRRGFYSMPLSPTELVEALRHLDRGDWKSAHEIVQRDEDSALSCWAHGIVHILEGDLPNARYWYGEAKRAFPANPAANTEIAALRLALTG